MLGVYGNDRRCLQRKFECQNKGKNCQKQNLAINLCNFFTTVVFEIRVFCNISMYIEAMYRRLLLEAIFAVFEIREKYSARNFDKLVTL